MIHCEKYNIIEDTDVPEPYDKNCVRISFSSDNKVVYKFLELIDHTNKFLADEDERIYIRKPSYGKPNYEYDRLFYFNNQEVIENWKNNVLIPFSLEN